MEQSHVVCSYERKNIFLCVCVCVCVCLSLSLDIYNIGNFHQCNFGKLENIGIEVFVQVSVLFASSPERLL